MRGKALQTRRKALAELAGREFIARCRSCKLPLKGKPVIYDAQNRRYCSMECFWDAEERLERVK